MERTSLNGRVYCLFNIVCNISGELCISRAGDILGESTVHFGRLCIRLGLV